LTLENYLERKHRRATVDTYKIGIHRAFYSASLFGITDSMSFFIIALIFYYGTVLVTHGSNSVSSMIQVVNLLLLGVANASAMLQMVPQISSSRTTATEMLHLANLPLHEPNTQSTIRLATPFPVRMNNLSFTYPNQSSEKALNRVSLTIDAGTCTAIAGPSGSGKSTIASILLCLYTPDEQLDFGGPPPLIFNGKSVLACNITSLRSFISIVSQTPILFPTSILENITYGLPEGSPFRNFKSAQRAASQAGIHSFIASLVEGYDTQVGDGGMGLSGGQAQRIAIARALVRRPKLLVLDEATSALDGQNAEGIREAIRNLVKFGVAVVMISHDIEMMRAADRIVVVENGSIAEIGQFEELKRAGGAFTRLLGGERQSVGLGLGLGERSVSPVKGRNRETWYRKASV
jgi:ATP-binding cassette subfamily B (MDR/TAP) protein 1